MTTRMRYGITWIVLIGVVALAALMASPGPALAHALPTSYDPAQNAVLKAPPSHVTIHFSEHLNPDVSRIVVVNPSNERVDNNDSHVDSDSASMTVTLPLLPAGTYVVAWRSHSADDGHVAGGSYLFHLARADGTVPALTGALPSGNIIGGAGVASQTSLDLPNLLAALAHWAALAALTVLIGIIFWWRVVQPRQERLSAELATAINRRFVQGADLAMEAIIGASVVEVIMQVVILEGSANGLTSWSLISGVLFGSRYGQFILMRVVLCALGLAALWSPQLRNALSAESRRLVLPLFALVLAVAFVYSGHGGAVPGILGLGPFIDYLHVIANGIWLGGLFILALFILPLLVRRPAVEQSAYLVEGFPAFSLPALISVAALTLTGPLNAQERMTSFSQFWTTAYGVVLSIKILLFLGMVAISYYHAFRLRPLLAMQTQSEAIPVWARVNVGPFRWLDEKLLAFERFAAPKADGAVALAGKPPSVTAVSSDARISIMTLLKAEAAIGAGVLLCAALLGPLAGTLQPASVVDNSFGAKGGVQTVTGTVDGYKVQLHLDPGKFGDNNFTITVTNPDGSLASNGSVFLTTEMVEMDMGVNTIDLTPGASGTYSGVGTLPMAGDWRVTVVIKSPQDPNNLHRVTLLVQAGF